MEGLVAGLSDDEKEKLRDIESTFAEHIVATTRNVHFLLDTIRKLEKQIDELTKQLDKGAPTEGSRQ